VLEQLTKIRAEFWLVGSCFLSPKRVIRGHDKEQFALAVRQESDHILLTLMAVALWIM